MDRTRREAVSFFAFTFVLTFLLQLPAVLAHHGVIPGPPERFMALVGLGALGPTFGALLAGRLEGPGTNRATLARLGRWRVSPIWYVVALLTSGGLFTGAMALLSLVRDVGPLAYPPTDAARWIALVVFPLGEEIGWRGFALPRLQARFGGLVASVILGTGWGLWHAMMFDLAGHGLAWIVYLLPFFVAGSVFFTWLWNRTGGSLLLAVLAHAGAHLDNSNRALQESGDGVPVLVHTVAFVALALVLVALDRKAFGALMHRP
jgi:membrane protease YdiL (CAAX protease family)